MSGILFSSIRHLMKGREFPVGHISRRKGGAFKKVAPGKWELVVDGGKKSIAMPLVRMKVTLTKELLQGLLTNGHYSIISAGRNPAFPAEAKLKENDPMFEKRHEELRASLESKGMRYTEVVGQYGGTERSFVVHHSESFKPSAGKGAFMVLHKKTSEHQSIRDLGKKFNQDSVIHVNKGTNELHYTTGEHEGTFHPGSGHEMKPLADDYFTQVDHPKGSASKFALNFDWDSYTPITDAVMKGLKSLQLLIKAAKKGERRSAKRG